jgi:hypothetical protein
VKKDTVEAVTVKKDTVEAVTVKKETVEAVTVEAVTLKKDTVEAASAASTQSATVKEMQNDPAAVTAAAPARPPAVLAIPRAPTPPPSTSFSSSAGMDIEALFASSPLLSAQDKVG